MEEAVLLEQQSTLYRLANLREFGLESLRKMREKAEKMYQELECWYSYAFDIENKQMDELVSTFL